MIKGINLTLKMGPAVPLAPPRAVVDALQSVRVISQSGETPSSFELRFALEKNSPLTALFMLSGGASIPVFRILLIVTINGTAQTLIDGVATHQQIAPGSGGEPSILTVQGKDLTSVMDFIPFSGLPYPAMPPFARVNLILAKYSFLGVIPKVIPSLESPPLPTDRIPTHQGTDLSYIRALAREAGYTFYLEPGPAPGTTIAFWGPPVRIGTPQPALTIDSDAADNVENLSFSFDKEGTEIPVVFIQNQLTKAPIPIPIPSQIPLFPPLGLVPPLPPKVRFLDDTAQLSPIQALVRGFAYAAEHSDAVSGSGSLDVLRYGRVLKPRGLVGVRGAGNVFDGDYFVERVTSELNRDSFKQNFSIKRSGLLPARPTVTV